MQTCDVLEHPARSLDLDDLAQRFWTSLTGGEHWDRQMVALKPELASCGSEHAQYTLDACVDERITDVEDLEATSDLGKEVLRTWCGQRARTCADILAKLPIVDGHVRAHRIIACAPAELKPALGVFWTHDFANWPDPYAPWSEEGRDAPSLVIEALVPAKAVEWEVSCMALMDWFTGDCESELRLRPGFPVRIVGCVRLKDDRPIDIPDVQYTT